MQKLLFFSRVAFICNICFLVTFFAHYIPFIENGVVSSTMIIMGNVLSIVVNVMINLAYIILKMTGQRLTAYVPAGLIGINFIFLVFQVILLVK